MCLPIWYFDDIVECVKYNSYFSIDAKKAKDVRKTGQLSLVIKSLANIHVLLMSASLKLYP